MGIWRNSSVAIDSGVAVFERVVKKMPQLQAIIGVGASQKRKQAMEFRGVPMRSFVMEREKDSGCVQPKCTIKRVTQCANDGQGGICEKFHKRLIAASFLSGPVAFQYLSGTARRFRPTTPGPCSQILCGSSAETASVFAALRRDKSTLPLQPASQVRLPCNGPASYF